MKKLIFLVLTAGMMLYGKETAKTNSSQKKYDDKSLIQDLSKTDRPQDDFFKYVNGNWDKTTKIPSTKGGWGVTDELIEKNQNFLKELIGEIKNKKLPENSEEYKLITLYNSYLNTARRDKEGINPIKEDLAAISAIKNLDDIQKYTVKKTKDGSKLLYDWSVATDLNDARNYGIFLVNPKLGLPRSYYQNDEEEDKEILDEYTKYVNDMLGYLGEKNTEEKAKKIVAFEKEIAKLLLTDEEQDDITKYNNPMKISEIAKKIKNIDIQKFLKDAGVNTDNINVEELKYYENLDKIINMSNIEVIKDYMKFQLISGSAGILDEKTSNRSFEFYGKVLSGRKERDAIEKRALDFVSEELGEIVGKVYVEKNFSAEAKKNTEEMIKYIKIAFQNRIKNLTWMSEETKKAALEKLSKINSKIGYPNVWRDFASLKLNPEDTLYGQISTIKKWYYSYDLKKVGKPVDKNEWGMDAHEVNAYYSPTENEIVFPAGILQRPFYSFESQPGVNFGGIGAVIGHEATHGFDVNGASYDGDGNAKEWWKKEDKDRFDAATKKLADQFSKYTVANGVHLNGVLTLTENIADLGGTNIAYDALQLYLKDHPEKNVKFEGYTQEELFFMSYARSWREKITDESLKNLVKSDPHSPPYYRVNGVLENMDTFHELFKTKKGDKLYKEPKDRIKIW